MSDFVHLHLHSQYSLLDGAIKLKDLVKKAKSQGQTAVAVTDHGNMHGAVEFYQAATSAEIKPIIGCEVYITAGSRLERKPTTQGGAQTHHITLLAKNNVGYQNLCKLVTLGYLEGFYFKPRIDLELLSEYSEGLVCLSGCAASQFASFANKQDKDGALDFVRKYQRIFSEDYYLEVQPHRFEEQKILNKLAREIGTELGVPLVATNDCHYLEADDKHAQEVLMCVSMAKLITDPDRITHEDSDLHFKSKEEMLIEMPDFSDAVSHTNDIAAKCGVTFDFSNYHMPRFDPPKGLTLDQLFEKIAKEGLEERFQVLEKLGGLTPELKQEYYERLEEEIGLIEQMGFPGYFLVVSDFIRWAKDNDIPVGPGRGSAAGSLVAYAMFITDVDPISNNLLFERFLNPERVSLPDIDVDFCIFGREKVIEYVCNKYGKDKVAQILTFGTLKAKAAIKDVGRVLGLSFAETDKIAKLIPAPRQGFDYPIDEALKMEKRLREYADGEGRELIETARKLEGLSRHTSTHAAGIVIADRPIVEFVPLMSDKDDQVVTQFSMNWVEKIGLVKFDFLGLKTLTVLHKAVSMIEEQTGDKIILNELPLDDEKTYKLISLGRTIGVFQLESSGITEMVSRLKPNCFEDIVAILALYRPGPLDAGMVDHYINRKHGREIVSNLHPILEPILKDTYGIILYQEQIMQIARDMGGYTLGEADMLRRAMGKKKPEEMAKQREKFVVGSVNRDIPEHIATEVFNQMETFARYGFNRSHSVAYALISFQTAYLKAHYPKHFMASLMTYEMGDTDKTLKNLNECKEMKIEILPPDVNRGDIGFKVDEGKILFGLAAIKGVGEKAAQGIIETIKVGGQFKSLQDFAARVDSGLLNKRVFENLIKSGAFSWSELSRAELMARMDDVIKRAQKAKERANSNQMDLFAGSSEDDLEYFEPNRELLPEWPTNIRLSNEKEALGFYLTGHPLEKFAKELARFGTLTTSDLKPTQAGSQVTLAGVITFLKLKNTKKGDRYASFVLEDLLGTLEVIVWPDVYRDIEVQKILNSEDPILVTGRLDISDERRTLIANKIDSAIALRDRSAKEAVVMLLADHCSEDKLADLRELLRAHKGECPVKLVVKRPAHSETVLTLPKDVKITPSEQLCDQVEQLFGEPVMTFR